MKSDSEPQTIYLKDYCAPRFLIDQTDLIFDISDTCTTVSATLHVKRNGSHSDPLVLDGEELTLLSVSIDSNTLNSDQYVLSNTSLTIPHTPNEFVLRSVVTIHPETNTSLEGLYAAKSMFCTQCEAQGFRKITYYLDRPDIMSKFTTRIIADKKRFPILLSNGNLIESGSLPSGKHFADWRDPFNKPCYLFALVAGDLACVTDSFTTMSGRKVDLKFYVETSHIDQCSHAVQSLKNAMRWDEETFGREYDLDLYMVVATSDFNMGAMENKGLNIFNTKYVLAKTENATDEDFRGIEGVIGHEYFHNWTGNRITCRDWFQLSLKEGLTVFRDQEFSADMGSRGVKRIHDVRVLRASQFMEDAGPMAHPVRPESYIEVNNFYTATVYNKGAEVIRMMHTLLGKDKFRAGMDLYFERHDGQAVTCDDFVKSMEDASGVNLSQFRQWYSRHGTPVLKVTDEYDMSTKQYKLHVAQAEAPFHIPLQVALLCGNDVTHERCLNITREQETFVFDQVLTQPIPSLLRNFSSPIKVEYAYSDEHLRQLIMHDDDRFNRWEAGQKLSTNLLLRMVQGYQKNRTPVVPDTFVQAMGALLKENDLDVEWKALALILPSESYIGEQMEVVDVDNIFFARETLRKTLGCALKEHWLQTYKRCQSENSIGHRALQNVALSYLMTTNDRDVKAMCLKQSLSYDNMTTCLSALANWADQEAPEHDEALNAFYERFKHDDLVLDKWFSIQALARRDDTLKQVQTLMKHPAFSIKNPNKVRALIGAFCSGNIRQFHRASGEGYQFLAQQIITLNEINPQIAARLLTPLTQLSRHNSERQNQMRFALEMIRDTKNLSPNVYEIVSRCLI